MKLQQGDYVTNLTEEQFNELIEISNSSITWNVSISEDCFYIDKSVMYKDKKILHSKKSDLDNQLPFEEFKQRAINTFKDGSTKQD